MILRSGVVLGACWLALAGGSVAAQEREVGPVIRDLTFVGNTAIDDLTLSTVIGTTNSTWFATSPLVRWIGLGEKRYFDPQEFQRDVLRLTLLYRKSGYLEVAVDTVVRRRPDGVSVSFRIREGLPVRVERFDIQGLDSVADREAILQDLPLHLGDPFNRYLLQSTADTLVGRLRDRGYPSVAAFQGFDVDRAARRAEIDLDLVVGPRATVGAIDVVGVGRVDSGVVRNLLATRPGQLFRQRDIVRSQLNLYGSDLFRYAAVRIDTTRFAPGDTIVPLVAQVNESRAHRLRSSAGYGSNDCFRFGVGWTARNFLGGGRVLDITGRVSKVGVGDPLDWGLADNLCRALRDDDIGSSLANYTVNASIRRPALFSPHNTGTLSLFGERRSEFKVYRREEVGGAVGLVRETARRIPVSLTYRLSWGRTAASAASFCAFLDACTDGDIRFLSERQRLATVTATLSLPRSNSPLDPTRGYQASLEATHSSRVIGSAPAQQFTRVVGDIAWYRPLGRRVVLSWRVRGGAIVSPSLRLDAGRQNFIPPEQRFYGGGPNDVRGYDRNELGPVVYVVNEFTVDSATGDTLPAGPIRFAATGGNTLAVGNVELRLPSPVFGSRVRWALFVDAGAVWVRGEATTAPATIRVTPGVGLRVTTPLGPARLDVAWNPYDRQPGTLFLAQDGNLVAIANRFTGADQPRRKYTIHFSVGQPF